MNPGCIFNEYSQSQYKAMNGETPIVRTTKATQVLILKIKIVSYPKS